jgi:CRISPR/Cas system CSM-associated protein Csm3 (group 7 of RAMP superfamily)
MTITLMTATVRVEPGWAVGAVARSGQVIDREILLDAAGLPWIPGSALAGSLRAHLATAAPRADERLMGSVPPGDRAESARSTASPLWILGAAFTPDADCGATTGHADGDISEIAGQTAVDRRRGAALPKSLRFSRLVSSGGTVTVYIRHDGGTGPLSTADLEFIARWRPAIGGGRTRGCGRARLAELRYGQIDPATPAGAAIWLSHSGPGLFDAVLTDVMTGAADEPPWLEAGFEIADGLLVGDGLPGRVASSRKRNGRPFIPGSAWKGVIRSRAEFIIRSRYGRDAACQQQAGCGGCVACAVFGHQGRRGLLAFRDSYVEAGKQGADRTHVGIDRVTGGSRNALLFQTAPVVAGGLTLRIDALGPVEPWVRTVIQHVLRDIDDGLIGVGSRSTRGLGTLRLLGPPAGLEPVVIPGLENPADRGAA